MHRRVSIQAHNEEVLKENASRQAALTKDPVEKIRLLCLERGTTGIMGLGR